MSVSRAGPTRKKDSCAREPILIVSFELNKPTRPKMTIYEDSDIPALIDEFVRAHKLKSTAVAIINGVISRNLAEMREEEERLKSKSTRNKSTQGKDTSRKVERRPRG